MRRKYVYATIFMLLFVGIIIVIVVCTTTLNGWKDRNSYLHPFWQQEVIYQVYPRSFKDSDGDGTGDIKGVTSKVDYLRDLGIGIVWLSPVYQSPMADFGYDISNYTAIDPIFGTMEDFDQLIEELHSQGLKLVMDFVPNHSSSEHEWFQKSEEGDPEYADYYVWADSKGVDENGTQIPPNNWVSEFRGSAWEWSETRQQFYFHQFLKEQPDLNFRSQSVREEIEAILTFWLEKGVDGFRVDALKFLFEVEDLSLDEPVAEDSGTTDPDDPAYWDHIYTTNQPETYEMLREWRALVDTYPNRVLMVEVYAEVDEVMMYYGNDTHPLADFPFNFFMIDNLKNRSELSGQTLKDCFDLWLYHMPPEKWPNWVLGNHDNERVATRLGEDLVDALNMVSLLLPGTPVTYYGEEIGMTNTFISWEDTVDPEGCRWGPDKYQEHSRDPERTPMQWTNESLAGFTTGSDTWLPVNPKYKQVNVVAQTEAEHSHLKLYKELTKLRRDMTFQVGHVAYPYITKEIFSFTRFLMDSTSQMVVVNTEEYSVTVDLHHHANYPLPSHAKVVLRSSSDTSDATCIGCEVSLNSLPLLPGEGLVLDVPRENFMI